MSYQAWVTIVLVIFLFVALIKNLAPPDLLFFGATTLLTILGIITPTEAFAGFSNPGMLTVAVLFVVAAGLRETGVLDYLRHHVLGQARTERAALRRLVVAVLPMSAFLNNTPIVAMFVPIVMEWCRQHRVSPSKLLIPLSYVAILGGTLTLIGTSTNLIVQGLIIQSGLPGLHLFEIGKAGIPYAVIGLTYLFVFGPRLLPVRQELLEQLGESQREYLIEMLVQPGCRLAGKTVEQAGLHHLPGLFIIEIERNGTPLGPVSPDRMIQANDRLVFTGIVSSIVDLKKIPGLVPAVDPAYEISPEQQRQRRMVEAVISQSSPLISKTIAEADFGAIYGAAVVAVHRGGKRIEQKISDIKFQPGDTLLLQVRPNFLRVHRNDPAFYLLSNVDEWRPLRWDKAWIAVLLFVILIVLMSTNLIPVVAAAASVAVLMVLFGCIAPGDARQSIEWQVLITIAAAFGVGSALENSGAASTIAGLLVESTQVWGPLAALAVIYLLGSIMTELITNNAAAVLLFPFCLETARLYQVSPMPFFIALALAASASFMTPIGYQTNMMVYGPGGYRFGDFLRVGGPLNLLLWLTAIVIVPLLWPF